jgi:gamma-glutamyl phosphate reductase
MRALVLIALIFSSTQIFARELNYQEKLVTMTLERNLTLNRFMVENIATQELSLTDYLSFQLMKKACLPLELAIEHVKKAPSNHPDQSVDFAKYYAVCSEGALGLSALYVRQH